MTVKDYYYTKYGEADRVAEFSDSFMSFNILKWNKSKTDEGVVIYATQGLSNYGVHKFELFIGLTPEADSIIESIAECCAFFIENNKLPVYGSTLTISFPLWESTNQKTYLFSNGTDIIPPIKIDKTEVTFIQLVPITKEEKEYKIKNGVEAFWKMIESNNIAYWSSKR